MTVFCKNCRHHTHTGKGYVCAANVTEAIDPVTGYPFTTGKGDCYAERDIKGRCGPDGKLYKGKPLAAGTCA